MKSKAAIYLLGLLVLGIWGVIVYRIYLSVHAAEHDAGVFTTPPLKKEKVPRLYPDTFSLLLNYPDPFTGETMKTSDTVTLGTIIRRPPGKVLLRAPAANPVSEMKYLGFVSDAKGSNRVAVISFRGTEKMMKEGDTIQKVKILTIKKTGLVLQYHGKITTIKTE